MSSYGLGRPSGSYYSPSRSSYGTIPNYGSYGGYSKPSYTPNSSKYGSSSYITPTREKSVGRDTTGGYTSDYGKSGYASDYGKSGYASDRSKVGYASDYNAKPNSAYSSYSKPSYGYGSNRNLSRQNSITGSERLSRQNSVTGNENLSRHNSITGVSLSRQNSVSGKDSIYRRDSCGALNNNFSNYGGYSRSQSKEEVSNKPNGLNHSESKSKVNCKAPADFTTDESESEETESEEESELECDEMLVVTRPTSPNKDNSNGTSSNKIAVTKKEKVKINLNKPRDTTETSCQVIPEDIPAKRERFISSRPTSLYLNKYYPSPSSRYTSTPSTRSYGTGSSETTPKTPENNASKIPVIKQQLSVDESTSAGGFSRDASPNARTQNEEPNKVI